MSGPEPEECQVAELVFSTDDIGGEHFFGYYDKSPFDASGRYLLSHRVRWQSNRMPEAGDVADICIIDLESNALTVVGQTHAFNFQQGASLQWLGPDHRSRIIYNDYRDGHYVSVIRDILSEIETVLPVPVYSVDGQGRYAVCVNYDRFFWCRPGYNYACGGDPAFNCHVHPQDGITLLDLETGEHRLIIRTCEMMGLRPVSTMNHGDNYLEHLLFSPSGNRFFFMHRWRTADGDCYTRAYTAMRDGSDVRLLSDSGDVSHYAWQDDETVMVFGSERAGINCLRNFQWIVKYVLRPFRPLFKLLVRPNSSLERAVLPYHYHLIDALSGRRRPVGRGELTTDGHPSFHPHKPRLFVSDTYPDNDSKRRLYLYDMENERQTPIGRFNSLYDAGGYRCDLHPRWDKSGTRICIDSTHTGTRQMHVFDVSPCLERQISR